ncbi:hypothetical protein V6N13_141507 [Hibiscus sabdariffa]|uniref:Uncharacterized protein n=2 Tax=Hibiscus sabdariffa TaxID=183260 RepID=A0ABR2BK51_9ROSI
MRFAFGNSGDDFPNDLYSGDDLVLPDTSSSGSFYTSSDSEDLDVASLHAALYSEKKASGAPNPNPNPNPTDVAVVPDDGVSEPPGKVVAAAAVRDYPIPLTRAQTLFSEDLIINSAVLNLSNFTDLYPLPDHILVELFLRTLRAGKLTERVLKLFIATGKDEVFSLIQALNIQVTVTPVLPTRCSEKF